MTLAASYWYQNEAVLQLSSASEHFDAYSDPVPVEANVVVPLLAPSPEAIYPPMFPCDVGVGEGTESSATTGRLSRRQKTRASSEGGKEKSIFQHTHQYTPAWVEKDANAEEASERSVVETARRRQQRQ